MTDSKNIINKVFILLMDIVILAIRTIKHIILPNRKTKGNILNSMFIFFIGTVEILNNFEHGIFQMAKIFKHRYIRKGLIITCSFLFLLSSFEWAGDPVVNNSHLIASVVQNKQKAGRSISLNRIVKAKTIFTKLQIAPDTCETILVSPRNLIYPNSVERYLLIRCILI
jgi:hypothetical protein